MIMEFDTHTHSLLSLSVSYSLLSLSVSYSSKCVVILLQRLADTRAYVFYRHIDTSHCQGAPCAPTLEGSLPESTPIKRLTCIKTHM